MAHMAHMTHITHMTHKFLNLFFMYTGAVGWPYPLQKLRLDATVNGYANQQPTRMGIAGPGLTGLPRFAIWEGRSVPSRVGVNGLAPWEL